MSQALPPLARPHHDGSPAGVATPAGQAVASPQPGERFRVRLTVPHPARIDRVHLRSVEDGEPTMTAAVRVARGTAVDVWEAEVTQVGQVQRYRFLLDGPGGTTWLTQAGVVAHDVPDTWDFATLAGPPPPPWVPDSVLYQIFPDRFARAGVSEDWPPWALRASWDEPVRTARPASMRQLYGGDLPGIAERLDHLLALGVTGVYLNPVFPAPENHRYCAASFDTVDPFLGGDDALTALAATLHDAGLRLLGDLTLNHSGSTHPWFTAAQADPRSTEAGFYNFTDHPDGYESWSGVGTLPKFDHRSAELRRRLYEGADSVVARYLDAPFHLDGWRIDAANMVGRRGTVDVNHDVQRRVLATVRSVGEDRYVLAEHCHDATADLQGSGWHGTMDYRGFTWPVWSWLGDPTVERYAFGLPTPLPSHDAAATARTIDLVHGQLPWRSVVHSMALLGSHDTARWASVAGTRDRRHAGLAWLLTAPGVPSLLYGDELGLTADDDDAARCPMPWHDRTRWDVDTLAFTRRLIALRRGSVALRHGGSRWLHAEDDALVHLRAVPDERVLVAITRDASDAIHLDAGLLEATSATALLDHADLRADGRGTLVLPATQQASARVWRLGSGR